MQGLARIARATALVLCMAAAAAGTQTIEIAADAGGGEEFATTKNLELVLPARFFRTKGSTDFSTPYLAELYFSTDGGKIWESYLFFKDLDKPFEFTAKEEGRYGFFVVLSDQKGNRDSLPESGTEPQKTVLVDWTAPQVTLASPKGGDVIGAGGTIITWQATDAYMAEAPITIEKSLDGTAWEVIAEGIDNTGSYAWQPPMGADGRILLRVSAADEVGHVTSAATESPVLVDTAPPTGGIAGPTLSSKEDVVLDVASDDGDGSGAGELRLWTSQDNGMSWTPAGTTKDEAGLSFKATTGKYGLYVTAVDRAGNAGADPKPGEAPQVTLEINTKTPLVRLKTLVNGGSISGGTQVPIQWEAVTPAAKEKNVSIFLSPDGGNNWANVAVDITNSGLFKWTAPAINSSNCYLKVVVTDASGTTGEAQSAKAFTIDSTKPTSAIGVPPAVMSQDVGDLSTVLRPVRPTGSDAGQGASVTRAPAQEPPAKADEPVTGESKTTPRPDAPWTSGEKPPYTGIMLPDTTKESVMKAALAAYRGGQLQIAKDYLQQAVKMDPSDPQPHAELGKIYYTEGGFSYTSQKESFEAALYEFDKALELGGDNADVYNDRGVVLMASKRISDAEKSFRRATELGSRPAYWCNLGMALVKLGEQTGAKAAFIQALELDAEMSEANFYMGEISAAEKDWADAKAYYMKAVDGYGVESVLGKKALAGIQQAREALGEVEPEPKADSWRQKLDRIR